MNATTVAPLATYRNAVPYPFCPGCGHGPILDRLDEALVSLDLDPARVVLVSDIGCSGLSDQYFSTSAFHGLHGRSITYASGIKLARPELEVIVLMGDGGTGIGGAHLLSVARRNLGITVVVFNNFNYGMTGGQHSATTPPGAITSTTPGGNLERPLDLCATVAANGAAYAYRGTSFDGDLAERIAEAVRTPGFSLVDVWELCTAYFVPNNRASKRTLGEVLESLGFATGLVHRRDVAEYGAAYRAAAAAMASEPSGVAPQWLRPRFAPTLDRRFGLTVAGAAGGRVRSAARLLARAAVLSGLWAAQRDDYPVTVKTGHSLSDLVLSPVRIEHAGVERPDAVLVVSEEGRRKVAGRVARMGADGTVLSLVGLEAEETAARLRWLDPAAAGTRFAKADLSLVAVAATAATLGLVPPEALDEAARQAPAELAESGLAAVRAGLEIAAADLVATG
jgi:pyruvate/2-oxoacid:ferredoxin oxidoreductase beta subunit/Pyruvate/2-oxoacid:ferredoxin oxidoreductase gamma subunit